MSYYISPRFLNKLAVHITKNFLELPGVQVPLILGIHGRKGEGKSFQCELVFEHMGVLTVHMSAGELESPDAGDPARLIRLRYREAAELSKVRGKMCVLMINDLDAGAGRFDQGTQYTVNTQLVNGTLMNIADNPTDVQLPGSYDSTPLQRVPIIVTGNDFSTLYAPLIRDGRMEKFYWEPNREDKIGIVSGIFEPDRLSSSDIERLVDTFPNQSIDFFSALRARIYDEQILQFIHKTGIDRVSLRVVNSAEGPPEFRKPDLNLSRLVEFGNLIVQEQQQVQNSQLAREYKDGSRFVDQGAKNDTHMVQRDYASTNQSTKPAQPNGFNYPSTRHNEVLPRQVGLETLEQVRNLLTQGYHLGIEHVDQRRFRTGSWQSCGQIVTGESEAVIALETCLADHSGEYVRIYGIEPKAKRRVMETIIQRPNDQGSGVRGQGNRERT
jgi:ribulose bisphosphate carboxylase small subunit